MPQTCFDFKGQYGPFKLTFASFYIRFGIYNLYLDNEAPVKHNFFIKMYL